MLQEYFLAKFKSVFLFFPFLPFVGNLIQSEIGLMHKNFGGFLVREESFCLGVSSNEEVKYDLYLGTHGTDFLRQNAKFILPIPIYLEKNGFLVNLEGRYQESILAMYPSELVRNEWSHFAAFGYIFKFVFVEKKVMVKFCRGHYAFS